MDRVERLTNLLALLLETREALTLNRISFELAGQYPEGDSARRGAFERDKAALREIGVPIETLIVQGGDEAGSTRYRIDRDQYELRGLALDDDERRALQLALAATRPGSGAGQEALWKLGAGVLDASAAVSAVVPDDPALPVLRQAVADRRAVTFRYRELDRVVDPWGLLLRNGNWYLIGFDHARCDRRTFRIDRREGDVTVVPGSTFERPAGFDAAAAFATDPVLVGADPEAPDARVRIDAGYAAAAIAGLGPDRVLAEHPDGSVEVSVPAANWPALRNWVLGFMEHAELVGPPELRQRLVEWLECVR